MLTAAACQLEAPAPDAAPTASERSTPSPTPPVALPTSPAEGDGTEPEAPVPTPSDCDEGTRDVIDRVVGDQLAAFADDDYARALEYASAGFRSQFDVERFRQTITRGFPVAADAAGHESGPCVHPMPGAAQVVVEVTAEDGRTATLVYRMLREEGRWRIDGAQPVGRPDDEPTGQIA